ncbi:hypothetical protein NLX83_38090 [Allokutzneria sp. A3M-2-11 16]|uniref:hypothetical protein n=1 Tax=Allokutzneria sp. A3M-2-11 16 TaxID=2962043 RepID=UPI0020B6DF5F|nr:hypothetical protein [Allokutzneria sp. A3M-2-11 16]MCP3805092.1 hypothetical protein [Allokutzneria sp. A3M-2-11 16]
MKVSLGLAITLVLTSVTPASADVTVTALGVPANSRTASAEAVNNDGVIVGRYWGGAGDLTLPLVWRDAGRPAAVLQGLPDSVGGEANAVSSAGTVAGMSWTADGNRFQAVRWDRNDKVTALDSGNGSGEQFHTSASGVNSLGTVVGTLHYPDLTVAAVRWSSTGVRTELPCLPGHRSGRAEAVNDGGTIAGICINDDSNPWHAVRWAPDGTVTKLATLPPSSSYSEVRAINRSGTIVGSSTSNTGADSRRRAVRWDANGAVTELPAPSGSRSTWADGISDDGVIVGGFETPEGQARPVRWAPDGRITELVGLGPNKFGFAHAVNTKGMIVGSSGTAVRWSH